MPGRRILAWPMLTAGKPNGNAHGKKVGQQRFDSVKLGSTMEVVANASAALYLCRNQISPMYETGREECDPMSSHDLTGQTPQRAAKPGDGTNDPSATQPAAGHEAEHEAGHDGQGGDEHGSSPAFFEYWNQMNFVSWMGARIVESSDGHATVYFEPGEHHRGAGVGGRAVTGAVQAYIFDIVTGAAVASLAHGTRPQVTVELDVTYEHPAYDVPLTFEANVLSGGHQIAFVDAVCTDTTGAVCSRARAIYRRFDRRITASERLANERAAKSHTPNE